MTHYTLDHATKHDVRQGIKQWLMVRINDQRNYNKITQARISQLDELIEELQESGEQGELPWETIVRECGGDQLHYNEERT